MRRRFIQLDGQLVEVGSDWRAEPQADFHIMPDISGYKSMLDGSWIGSRSTHREHLRAHGVIEVGNEKLAPKLPTAPPGLKDELIRQTNRYIDCQRTGRTYGRE